LYQLFIVHYYQLTVMMMTNDRVKKKLSMTTSLDCFVICTGCES